MLHCQGPGLWFKLTSGAVSFTGKLELFSLSCFPKGCLISWGRIPGVQAFAEQEMLLAHFTRFSLV